MTGKALLATRAGRDDDASFAAGVTVAMCGGVPLGVTCTAAGTNDTSNVIVQTSKPDGTAGEAHAFYITVF